jgi:ATP-dependent Clp protease ATP-binding subunit ClpA
MLPFSPRLRIALATAEACAKDGQRRDVTCTDIIAGIVSLSGGVADNLLKARGFEPGIVPPVPLEKLDHEVRGYSVEALRALSAAFQYAAGRSQTLIGIEDMLVGILSPPSAEISDLFRKKNISPEELLSEVKSEIS